MARLEVDGLIDTPLTLTYDQLITGFTPVSLVATLACAGPDTAVPGDGISLSSLPLNCDILLPGDDEQVPAGPLRISGWALAGDGREIGRVDVSLDGGHA